MRTIMRETVMGAERIDPHLTATIVGSYVRHHTVGADQVSNLIATVHRALGQLGQPTQPGEVLVPAVSVRRSVSPNEVVCMDCGWRGKTLRRHITTRHFLSRDEYLKRWGLRHEHPLTAPAYSERRSILAKELGLGRKPAAQATLAAITTASSPAGADGNSEAKPSRRRNARSGSKSGDLTNEAVAAPTTPRKRRARARVASPEAEQNPSSTAET
jgi:predicted transcriptional regulator